MIGVLLHLGACALDELFENFEEFRADLGWAATFAASAARMGLAARLDPEAARAVGEVARLRVERDLARLEHAAAVEVCEELRGRLRACRELHHEALRVLESLLPKVEVTP